MKKTVLMLMVLSITMLSSSFANAQYEPSSQFGLPEGAIARFGRGSIHEIMYSRDGTQLAVTTSIGVWLHDAQTGKELDIINKRYSRVNALFSPDGNILLGTSGSPRQLQMLNVMTGELIKTLHWSNLVCSAAFSADSNIIAAGGYDGTIRLWDATTGKHLKTLKGYTYCGNSLKFSPDSKTIATGHWDGTVLIWDIPQR